MSFQNGSKLEASYWNVQGELSSRALPLVIGESLILASIALVAVIGNMAVLVVIYRCDGLRTPTNLLVISLALSDLFTAVCVIPISTGVLATGKMFMGRLGCQVTGCLAYLFENVTFHTICIIAVNRVLLMLKPSWYEILFNFKSTAMTILSSWIFQLLYAVVPAIANWSEPFLSPGYTTCALFVTQPDVKQFYRAQKEVIVIGGFCIIMICYIVAYLKIQRRSVIICPPNSPENDPSQMKLEGSIGEDDNRGMVNVPSLNDFDRVDVESDFQDHRGKQRRQKTIQSPTQVHHSTINSSPYQDKPTQLNTVIQSNLSHDKTTKVLFFITLSFLMSWIPLSVMVIVESYQSAYVSRQVALFGMSLLFLGKTFNPIILAVFHRKFRFQFYKIFRIQSNVVRHTPN